MSRRIITAGIVILIILTFVALELNSPQRTFTKNLTDNVKQKIDETWKDYRPPPPPPDDDMDDEMQQGTPSGSELGESRRPPAPASHTPERPAEGTARPPSSTMAHCKWKFSHYESSPYEAEWFSDIEEAQEHICKAVATEKHTEISKRIVHRVKSLTALDKNVKFGSYDSILPVEPSASDEYMSKMHYRRVCYDGAAEEYRETTGFGAQLIEPLWGMLRDPFDPWCGDLRLHLDGWEEAEGQSKQHIMPQGYAPYYYDTEATTAASAQQHWRPQGLPPWHSSLIAEDDKTLGRVYTKPSTVHLDLGSSYFGGWSLMGSGVAASGQWFYDHYHLRGPTFDRFIAVEVETLNDTIAYSQVPDDLVGKYTLMNVGLTMEDNDKLNTIDMIKRIIRPEDFFVFKLDIDSAPIEMPIIESLLADDPENGGASALIDELMFEHHVDFAPMRDPWAADGATLTGSLAGSYDMFRSLRRKGIRAHSWP